MEDSSHKQQMARQSEQQGRTVPVDLQPEEEDTLLLFDSLNSSLPDESVDALLLGQAAESSATENTDSAVNPELEEQSEQSNVIPLYAHEQELSFSEVLPKVFVAAAVLVLAVAVVPILDTSANKQLIGVPAETSAAQSELTFSDTDADSDYTLQDEPSAPDEEAVLNHANQRSADASQHSATISATQSDDFVPPAPADSREVELATVGDAAKQESLQNLSATDAVSVDVADDVARSASTASAVIESAEEAADVVTGVARTTIISTETAKNPTVVQGINITSAARVQRKITSEEKPEAVIDASADIETKAKVDATTNNRLSVQSPVPVVVLPGPSAVETQGITGKQVSDDNASSIDSDASSEVSADTGTGEGADARQRLEQSVPADSNDNITPSYRRSVHRWKAEILKLSKLGLQRQAELEYRMFQQQYPDQEIELGKR